MPGTMVAVPAEILRTERLTLRPLTVEDRAALFAIQSDPYHMRYYPHPFARHETTAWIDVFVEHHERYGHSLWAVEDATTGEFLGNVGPIHQRVDDLDEIELGWSITPARSRQGIASEAAAACRDWCWANLGVDHLISLVRPENEPSRGVAERIGMTVWKETLHGSQGWLHLVYRVDRPPIA
jgi:[ribosomal protein S5]-alanine N-acetyltransferase